MKKTFLSILLLGASILMFGQQDQVLMTINNQPIMASEFLYIYEKNNQESSLDKKTMDEYLDLFINFKLKVAEAIAQGVVDFPELPADDVEVLVEVPLKRPGSDKTIGSLILSVRG